MFKNRGTALLTAALMAGALSAGACNRGAEETAPAAEMQTQTPVQESNTPISVTGCLRAGEAEDTFVLTSSRAEEDGSTATYALNFTPGNQPEDLRDHVGDQVAVEGMLLAQQAVVGYAPGAPAAGEPVGTSGTPTVQTSTELALRELQVKELRPIGEACGDR